MPIQTIRIALSHHPMKNQSHNEERNEVELDFATEYQKVIV
jgi:hypothetical protein